MATLLKTSTFKSNVYEHWNKNRLIPESGPLIVGLSGGPDSVFLLEALCTIPAIDRTRIIAAHFNHKWRVDSDADMIWCSGFAEKLGCQFIAGNAEDFPTFKTGSREADSRLQRRLFFQQSAEHFGADAILLAHHADDQIETFFIRLIRGADLSGLCGIRPIAGLYHHMLLPFKKEQIIDYLDTHAIEYRTDSTNTDSRYLRNRIRKSCTIFAQNDARFFANTVRTMEQLSEADRFIDATARKCIKSLRIIKADTHALILSSWLAEDPYLQRRILAIFLCDAGASHSAQRGFYEEIIRFAHGKKSMTHTLSPLWRLCKKGDLLVIECTPSQSS